MSCLQAKLIGWASERSVLLPAYSVMEKYKRGDRVMSSGEKQRQISGTVILWREVSVVYNGAWTTQLTGSNSKVSTQYSMSWLFRKLRPISNRPLYYKSIALLICSFCLSILMENGQSASLNQRKEWKRCLNRSQCGRFGKALSCGWFGFAVSVTLKNVYLNK